MRTIVLCLCLLLLGVGNMCGDSNGRGTGGPSSGGFGFGGRNGPSAGGWGSGPGFDTADNAANRAADYAGAMGDEASVTGAAGASTLAGGAQTDTLSGSIGKAGQSALGAAKSATSGKAGQVAAAVAQAADRARAALENTGRQGADLGTVFTLYDDDQNKSTVLGVTRPGPPGTTKTGVSKTGVRTVREESFWEAVGRKMSDPFGQTSTLGTIGSIVSAGAKVAADISLGPLGLFGEAIDAYANREAVMEPGYTSAGVPYDAPPGVQGTRAPAPGYSLAEITAAREAQEKAERGVAGGYGVTGVGMSAGDTLARAGKVTTTAEETAAPATETTKASASVSAATKRRRGRSYTISTSPFGYTDLAYLLTPRLVGVS